MLETFFNSVSSVFVILLLTATGFILGQLGWMKKIHKDFISKLLISFFIPCNSMYGLLHNLNREMLLASGVYLLVPLATMAVSYPLSFLLAKLLRLEKKQTGLFILLTATSNAIFIGLPMCNELLGDASTPYVMLYYIVSNSMLYIVSMGIARTAMGGEKVNLGKTLLDMLKMPVVIAILVSIALLLLNIQLPSPIMSYLKYMSGAVTPLAMIISGFVIYSIGFKALRLNRGTVGVMIFRFLLAPLLAFAFCLLFGAEGLGMKVNLILASMPSVTIAVVIASRYGDQDDEMFASQGVAWTSIVTFVVTPVLMLLMQ